MQMDIEFWSLKNIPVQGVVHVNEGDGQHRCAQLACFHLSHMHEFLLCPLTL